MRCRDVAIGTVFFRNQCGEESTRNSERPCLRFIRCNRAAGERAAGQVSLTALDIDHDRIPLAGRRRGEGAAVDRQRSLGICHHQDIVRSRERAVVDDHSAASDVYNVVERSAIDDRRTVNRQQPAIERSVCYRQTAVIDANHAKGTVRNRHRSACHIQRDVFASVNGAVPRDRHSPGRNADCISVFIRLADRNRLSV